VGGQTAVHTQFTFIRFIDLSWILSTKVFFSLVGVRLGFLTPRAAYGPPMCFVRPSCIFFNIVSLYIMKNSYLISENTLCQCRHYLAETIAVVAIRMCLSVRRVLVLDLTFFIKLNSYCQILTTLTKPFFWYRLSIFHLRVIQYRNYLSRITRE
jgi:hypothetical protein